MSEKFIVAVDGSKNSFSASEQAIEIAKHVSASLHFVYVVDIRKVEIPLFYQSASFDASFEKVYIPPAPGLKEFYGKIQADMRAFGKNCLEFWVQKAEATGLEASSALFEGFPASILCEEARSGDLLVLGQKGENSHYKKETLGSTTEEILHTSPRPLLVCPEVTRVVRRILFPYTRYRCSENALQFYANVFSKLCEDFIVLVTEEDEELMRMAGKEENYLREHGLPVRILQKIGPRVSSIALAAQEQGVDLVLVGAHGESRLKEYLLGSLSVQVIRKSSIPIVVVY